MPTTILQQIRQNSMYVKKIPFWFLLCSPLTLICMRCGAVGNFNFNVFLPQQIMMNI